MTQTIRDVVPVEACAGCTHSRTEHLKGRLACLYVIDEQAGCSCAEFAEFPRDGIVGCKHDWRGTVLLACPRCEMEAPTDLVSAFWGVLIMASSAAFIAAFIVAWLMM